MIVHRINPRESKYSANDKRDPTGLINYITGGEQESEDELEQLTSYVTNSKPSSIHTNEKVLLVDYENIGIKNPEYASKEMYATALTCKSKTDIYYEHIVLSCPDFEKPDPKNLIAMAKDVVSTLGAERNQAVYAVHGNTINMHVHIALARTDQESCRTISNHLILDKLHYGTREVEIKFDTYKDEGIYETKRDRQGNYHIHKSEKHSRTNYTLYRDDDGKLCSVLDSEYNKNRRSDSLSRGAELMEVQSGRESLQTYARNHLSEISEAQSWDEVHQIAGQAGLKLEISKNGKGLIFSDATSEDLKVKASNVSRQFSKPKLEKVLGEFTASSEDYSVNAISTYDSQKFADRFKNKSVIESEKKVQTGEQLSSQDEVNLQKVASENKLYKSYLKEKEKYFIEAKQLREAKLAEAEAQNNRVFEAVENEFSELVSNVQDRLEGADLDLALLKIEEDKWYTLNEIQSDHIENLDEIKTQYSTAPNSYPSYREWVDSQQEEDTQNSIVYEVSKELSIGSRKDIISFNYTASEEQFSYANDPVLNDLQVKVQERFSQFEFEVREDKEAFVVAGFKDSEHVLTDKGEQIEVHELDREAIEAALLIGDKKSEGEGIFISSGNTDFNQIAKEIAEEHNIKIHVKGGSSELQSTDNTVIAGGLESAQTNKYEEDKLEQTANIDVENDKKPAEALEVVNDESNKQDAEHPIPEVQHETAAGDDADVPYVGLSDSISVSSSESLQTKSEDQKDSKPNIDRSIETIIQNDIPEKDIASSKAKTSEVQQPESTDNNPHTLPKKPSTDVSKNEEKPSEKDLISKSKDQSNKKKDTANQEQKYNDNNKDSSDFLLGLEKQMKDTEEKQRLLEEERARKGEER